ncbi:glutathione S-transferase A-like [Gouania willdenowi]|uniref:Glutathione S-transferase A-like n=1 Tax=Gouania willdenowi TaxID=441366 RepID=A0A8C5EGW9_GOUWI|nr:glutathione S-transferase A-like [Gouania willdenowi]
MAQDITLMWGSGSPPCWRVMIALEEKNLKGYKSIRLSFEKGEHKSKQVMDINPRGQLPAFKIGNKIINESYGACMFLENEFKSQGTKLIPDCPTEQAMVYQRMFEGLTLAQKLGAVVYYSWNVPEDERRDSAIKRNKAALTEEAKLWEGYLAKQCKYLASKDFSMADVLVYPYIAYFFHFGLCEKRYPNLARYYHGLKDRPSIKKTWPPSWVDIPDSKDVMNDV